MAILSNPRERTRFLKFAVVGSIGFAVDFAIYNLLGEGFHVPAEWAQVGSFSVAVLSNFILNRNWTFPDSRTQAAGAQLAQFGIVSLFGLGIRTVIILIILGPFIKFFENLGLRVPLSPEQLGENFALAVVVVIVMFWNFFANRYWTYNDID